MPVDEICIETPLSQLVELALLAGPEEPCIGCFEFLQSTHIKHGCSFTTTWRAYL